MRNYLLKYDVHNFSTFPKGTAVKPIEHEGYNFEVVRGKLKGEKGFIVDGLRGWVVDDNDKNRKIIKSLREEERNLQRQLKTLYKGWKSLRESKL